MSIPSNFNLGYACICTELRKKNIFSSRTCRLKTLQDKGVDYVKNLAIQNLKDLKKMLIWNVENNIFFMRISSDIFPFASHKEYGYSVNFAKDILEDIGKFSKENKIRITMHPSQYNVLSSPRKEVIENTILDLKHHCDILDTMMLDKNSVIIIHGGGCYDNKTDALKRLVINIFNLDKNVRDRLVLENCEMSYNVQDLLPISKALRIPLVIDMHHDAIYPSSQPVEFYFDQVFAVWKKRGIKPKIHVSNSIPGIFETDNKTLRRKHSDYIQFLHKPLYLIKFPIDIMLECKMKEQALLKLRKNENT